MLRSPREVPPNLDRPAVPPEQLEDGMHPQTGSCTKLRGIPVVPLQFRAPKGLTDVTKPEDQHLEPEERLRWSLGHLDPLGEDQHLVGMLSGVFFWSAGGDPVGVGWRRDFLALK